MATTSQPAKILEIRKEARLYLGMDVDPTNTTTSKKKSVKKQKCQFCQTRVENPPEGRVDMLRRGACKAAWYYSKDCQRWDWIDGGHKSDEQQ